MPSLLKLFRLLTPNEVNGGVVNSNAEMLIMS